MSPTGTAPKAAGAGLGGLALVVVLSAQLVVVLDFSIVNVALPDISRQLSVSSTSVQWVVTAYAITFGGLLILGGRAADLVGRRTLLVWGLVAFGIASAAGGVAADFRLLVASRALQGIAAAVVAPAGLSILTTAFHGRDRTRVLGYFGATASVGFVLGLVLGGVLVEAWSWRAVFFVNVPVCLLCAILGQRLLPPGGGTEDRRHLDVAGAVLVTAGTAALVYAPTAGVERGWVSVPFGLSLLAAVVVLAAFFWHERRSPAPLLPPSIFRSHTLAAGDAVTLLLGAWNGGEVLILSLYCQQVLGYSPLQTGLVVVPQGVAGLLRGLVGASIVARLGIKRFLAASAAVAAVGLALLLRFPSTSHYPLLGLVLFVVGFGTTSAMFGAVVAGTAGVADDEQGVASALVNAARQIGSAIGVAALVSIAAGPSQGTAGPSATAAGYRLAMGVAAALAVVATVISVAFVGTRACTQHHDRLRRHQLHEPWPSPELLPTVASS
ncbi:MAG TPA: MFS transporter [Acidimicrobiales bacterium]|nr:MFS transporter [Acidimicrobiales bacterium]